MCTSVSGLYECNLWIHTESIFRTSKDYLVTRFNLRRNLLPVTLGLFIKRTTEVMAKESMRTHANLAKYQWKGQSIVRCLEAGLMMLYPDLLWNIPLRHPCRKQWARLSSLCRHGGSMNIYKIRLIPLLETVICKPNPTISQYTPSILRESFLPTCGTTQIPETSPIAPRSRWRISLARVVSPATAAASPAWTPPNRYSIAERGLLSVI